MKTLVVPSWYPPNGGRFFKLQAEALAKLGHQVDVLVLEEKSIFKKSNPKIDASASPFINEMRHSLYRIPKWNTKNTSRFIQKFKRLLKKYLDTNKVDVIHVHSALWAGVVVADIAVQRKIPYIITEHRSLFFKPFPFSTQRNSEVKKAFQQASQIIAVSKQLKNILVEKYELSNSIAVLPNMIDTDFFKPDFNLKKDKNFTFVSVGTLNKTKGIDILLDAFALIKNKSNKCKLKIVGSGKEAAVFKAKAKELLIENDVQFCGYKSKDELLKIYQKTQAFVLASRQEPFGVVLIEALSCGLPVVATKSGGPQDIINTSNGYLAEPNNASSLQAKMQLMLDNYTNFDSNKIRQNVIDNYSKEVVVSQIEKVLKECLQEQKP